MMMMRTHSLKFALVASAFVVALSIPSRDVYSQPVADTDAAQKADALFSKGKALYAGGKTREAHEALSAAWASKKSYDIAANLGSVELTLAMYRDAAEHFAYALRTFPATGNKKQLAATKQLFDQARAHVGGLTIKVSIEGAEVLVDGKSIGRSPIPDEVFVNPGERTIEAKLNGYEPARLSAKLMSGGSQGITLSLVPTAPPPVASASASPVPTVTAIASAAPPPSASSTAPVPPAVSAGPRPILILASGVLAAGGLATGIGFTVAANGKSDDAAALVTKYSGHSVCLGTPAPAVSADCKTLKSITAEQSTMRNAAFVSFAAGGVFALVAAGLGVWRLKAPTATGVLHVSPVVGARESGVLIGGAW